MEHPVLACIILAETASQLVLGGMFCAVHFLMRKHVEWVGFGLASISLSIAGASISGVASNAGPTTRIAAMGFSVGLTIAIALITFGLAWLTRSPRLNRLGWLTVAVGVVWQPILGYYGTFVGMPTASLSRAAALGARTPPNVVSWAFFLCLLALMLAGAFSFARSNQAHHRERFVVLVGMTGLGLGLLAEAATQRWFPQAVTVFPHAGFLFTLLLSILLLRRYRTLADDGLSQVQQISQMRQELALVQSSLERTQRELRNQKQLAAVGELAAAIAHEVRNPLAIIMNAAAGLRRPTLGSDDRATLLSILDEEAARLNRLVTDLLRFARPVIIKRSSVSVLELARRAEGRLEDKHRLKIMVPEQPHLRFVQADANLLRLVFDNLVSNAFQAMPEGGEVTIAVNEHLLDDAKVVRIDIIDEGHGMDKQVLARAIDPFYTTRPSGTGLGLPIVQRIIEAHGGRLEIDSTLGQGTKVSMFLPIVVPASDGATGEGEMKQTASKRGGANSV